MRSTAVLSLALVLCLGPAASMAGEIEGTSTPVDGDGFKIEVRLFGVDAPELDQTCLDGRGHEYPCGIRAAEALAVMVDGKTVRCDKRDQDTKYGRPVAVCFVDGVDVGRELVLRGLAVAYRKYSQQYVAEESAARAAQRGLWAGTFVMPWDYRHGVRALPAIALPPAVREKAPQQKKTGCPPPPDIASGCLIKGNISKSGKIYHVPGSNNYERTKIDKTGERYFCNEADAIACGWRRPKG